MRSFLNRLWRFPKRLLFGHKKVITVFDSEIDKIISNFRQRATNVRGRVIFVSVNIVSYILAAFFLYIFFIIVVFEITLIFIGVGVIFVIVFYLSVFSFPLVLAGSILIYYITQKETQALIDENN